jgi:membrane protease YdiL (CAAX protease family)
MSGLCFEIHPSSSEPTMNLFSFLLAQLLFFYTLLVEPFLRINFYRRLKKQLNINSSARILFYRTQVLWEWSWVVVLVIITASTQRPLAYLGLTLPNPMGWLIMLALLLGIGLSVVLLRRNPGAMAAMQRSLEGSALFLPSTPTERKWYAATAITAGICEELLYRGFIMHYLPATFPFLDWLLVAIISGIIYGLSRAYQGFKGILTTALTGFSFSIVFVLSGSLLPAMAFHILAELRTLMLWNPEEDKKKPH